MRGESIDLIELGDGEILHVTCGRKADKEEVMNLYRAAVGTEGCTWSEDYPNEDILNDDIARRALYCARNAGGEILAVISVDEDPNVDALQNWSNYDGKRSDKGAEYAAELARLAVREDYQNRGIARKLIEYAVDRIKAGDSCKPQARYVHFLVSQNNERALRSYEKLCWANKGESDLFGEKWLCYELKL